MSYSSIRYDLEYIQGGVGNGIPKEREVHKRLYWRKGGLKGEEGMVISRGEGSGLIVLALSNKVSIY